MKRLSVDFKGPLLSSTSDKYLFVIPPLLFHVGTWLRQPSLDVLTSFLRHSGLLDLFISIAVHVWFRENLKTRFCLVKAMSITLQEINKLSG